MNPIVIFAWGDEERDPIDKILKKKPQLFGVYAAHY